MAEKKKKKTPGGFTTKTEYKPGLRKKGESFMDFTTRQHEQRYPGAQRMAREAGAGGWRAFTPAGAEYRRGIREEMPWLKQGQRYQSEDWKRMLANRQAGMYGTGAQVGGAPPGTRPAPTVGPNYNVLGRGQRPAIAPLQRKTAYMADPRNQATAAIRQITHPGGDASLAEARTNMLRHDFPAVVPPRFSRSYQEDMGTGVQPGEHRGFGRGYGVAHRYGSFPVMGPQMTGMDYGPGYGGTLRPRTPETTRPTWQQQDAFRRGWQMQGQQRNNRGFYNPLGGAPRPFVRSAPGRSQAQRGYMEQPGRRGTAQRMWAQRGYPWSPSYRELLGY